MKFINKKTIIILLIVLGFSCENDDNQDAQKNVTLIFGWFADSSCSGDCAQIYKINNEKVFKDIDYNFPEGDYFEGNFQEIINVNYQDYTGLINQLPNEIFNEPNGYLDCSECTNEFGGFYLEYEAEGTHKTWRFKNAQYPSYIESYRSLLLDKLADLNSL